MFILIIRKRLCLSLYFNESNSFLFVNATKIYQFKAKDSEKCPLCLGSILQDFQSIKWKKTGLNGCAYNFSVDYSTFGSSNIIDIHKY